MQYAQLKHVHCVTNKTVYILQTELFKRFIDNEKHIHFNIWLVKPNVK